MMMMTMMSVYHLFCGGSLSTRVAATVEAAAAPLPPLAMRHLLETGPFSPSFGLTSFSRVVTADVEDGVCPLWHNCGHHVQRNGTVAFDCGLQVFPEKRAHVNKRRGYCYQMKCNTFPLLSADSPLLFLPRRRSPSCCLSQEGGCSRKNTPFVFVFVFPLVSLLASLRLCS